MKGTAHVMATSAFVPRVNEVRTATHTLPVRPRQIASYLSTQDRQQRQLKVSWSDQLFLRKCKMKTL